MLFFPLYGIVSLMLVINVLELKLNMEGFTMKKQATLYFTDRFPVFVLFNTVEELTESLAYWFKDGIKDGNLTTITIQQLS